MHLHMQLASVALYRDVLIFDMISMCLEMYNYDNNLLGEFSPKCFGNFLFLAYFINLKVVYNIF